MEETGSTRTTIDLSITKAPLDWANEPIAAADCMYHFIGDIHSNFQNIISIMSIHPDPILRAQLLDYVLENPSLSNFELTELMYLDRINDRMNEDQRRMIVDKMDPSDNSLIDFLMIATLRGTDFFQQPHFTSDIIDRIFDDVELRNAALPVLLEKIKGAETSSEKYQAVNIYGAILSKASSCDFTVDELLEILESGTRLEMDGGIEQRKQLDLLDHITSKMEPTPLQQLNAIVLPNTYRTNDYKELFSRINNLKIPFQDLKDAVKELSSEQKGKMFDICSKEFSKSSKTQVENSTSLVLGILVAGR